MRPGDAVRTLASPSCFRAAGRLRAAEISESPRGSAMTSILPTGVAVRRGELQQSQFHATAMESGCSARRTIKTEPRPPQTSRSLALSPLGSSVTGYTNQKPPGAKNRS